MTIVFRSTFLGEDSCTRFGMALDEPGLDLWHLFRGKARLEAKGTRIACLITLSCGRKARRASERDMIKHNFGGSRVSVV